MKMAYARLEKVSKPSLVCVAYQYLKYSKGQRKYALTTIVSTRLMSQLASLFSAGNKLTTTKS